MDHATLPVAGITADIARAVRDPVLIADWVRATVRRHGIRYQPLPVDVFAGAGSRPSDAEVTLDTIEQLLLALARRGIVTDRQRAALHAACLGQSDPEGRSHHLTVL